MTYPYPQPYPTLWVCPLCRRAQRLVNFRRWSVRENARVLHDTCNKCTPEIPLSEMTPDQRERALAKGHGRATEARVDALNEREAEHKRVAIGTRVLVRNKQSRKNAWAAAVTTPLSAECTWAKATLANYKLRAERMGERDPGNWIAFLEAYVRVLEDGRRRAKAKLAARQKERNAPIHPSPDDANMQSYIFPESLATLRKLYSACVPLRGRRMPKDPAFLEW